jgi:hypothetical protein
MYDVSLATNDLSGHYIDSEAAASNRSQRTGHRNTTGKLPILHCAECRRLSATELGRALRGDVQAHQQPAYQRPSM